MTLLWNAEDSGLRNRILGTSRVEHTEIYNNGHNENTLALMRN